MKSKIVYSKSLEERLYPKLVESNNYDKENRVVLLAECGNTEGSKLFAGTVVWSGSASGYSVGYYDDWNKKDFKDFVGTITLSND